MSHEELEVVVITLMVVQLVAMLRMCWLRRGVAAFAMLLTFIGAVFAWYQITFGTVTHWTYESLLVNAFALGIMFQFALRNREIQQSIDNTYADWAANYATRNYPLDLEEAKRCIEGYRQSINSFSVLVRKLADRHGYEIRR